MLKYNNTKKRRIDKKATKLDINNNNSKKYKIKTFYDIAVYTKESKLTYLPGLYYIIS